MGEIKHRNNTASKTFVKNKNEAGSSFIETIISISILTVGLLAMLSAMTYAVLYAKEAEKKTRAKEIAGSIIENIFAIRDIQSQGGLAMSGWDAIQLQNNNSGIFIGGWFPVREGPGKDGIYGTADDSCAASANCTASSVVADYERNINISDIVESGIVRKRRLDVTVRYRATGNGFRQETISTIIANLPTN